MILNVRITKDNYDPKLIPEGMPLLLTSDHIYNWTYQSYHATAQPERMPGNHGISCSNHGVLRIGVRRAMKEHSQRCIIEKPIDPLFTQSGNQFKRRDDKALHKITSFPANKRAH